MRMFRSIVSACVAACLLLVTYSVSGAQSTGTASWDSVIAAAKKEGAVTMYANPGNDSLLAAAAAKFERKYGVKVTISYADGATNTQKTLIEAQTGHVLVDLYYAGLGPAATLCAAGYDVPLDIPNEKNIVKTFDVLPGVTPLFVNIYGILVNPEKLGKTPMPKSWADLLNPALAGKMVMQDPRIDGGGGTFFVATYDRMGPVFQKSLAALHPTINGAGSGSAAEEAVARGDYTLMLAGRPRAVVVYAQSHLKWIAPSEGTVVVPIAMMMIKGAPHPNAARLWANYLLEPEFQSNLSAIEVPVIKNVAIKNPLFHQKLKFLEVLPPKQDRQKYYAYARQLYGAQ